jgi:glycosyltransferase involved in cell wall biosynthesis
MNILFVHEVDWLSKVVFDIHSLAEGLSLRGHRVFAVDYENTWKKSGFFDFGSLRTRRFSGVSRALPGSSVELYRPGFIKIPGLSRLSVGLTSHRVIERLVRREKINAILLYSAPTTGLQTIRIARKYGVPVIFRSIDILHQLMPSAGLRPATRWLERRIYAGADRILALTPGLTRYVVGMGADERKVSLLLMPVDTDIFYPRPPSEELQRRWALGNDPVVLFMGTLFDFSGLDGFIPAFRRVIEAVPGARLLIVGDGPQRARLEALIDEHKLRQGVTITGFEPYETMPQYINLADVCVNTFETTGATRDIFPGKTVQFLACGKPFVATALPGMIAVIPGEEQGIIYVKDADGMVEAVIALLGSAERRARLGQAGLAYVRRSHSHESIARQLEEKIKEAIGGRSRPGDCISL